MAKGGSGSAKSSTNRKRGWMLSCRKDAPPDGGAPVTGVSERQATLHRWAYVEPPTAGTMESPVR